MSAESVKRLSAKDPNSSLRTIEGEKKQHRKVPKPSAVEKYLDDTKMEFPKH